MPIERRIGRVELAVAGAIAHQHLGKFLGGAVLETAGHLVDIVHAEEDIVGARDIGIEGGRAIGRRVAEREVQRDQAMVAPVPGFCLLAHSLREQFLAGHLYGGRKIDGAGDEFAALDDLAVGKLNAGSAAIFDDNLFHVGAGYDLAAAGFHHPRQRIHQGHRPADRQCETGDIGENRREHDAGARDILGGNHVHIRSKQRADALIDEMLAHHAE